MAISGQSVVMQFSIIYDAANGTVAYQETHTVNTSVDGLVNLVIGSGAREHIIAQKLFDAGVNVFSVITNRNPGLINLSKEKNLTVNVVNKELKNADLPDEIRVGAILRDNKFILPSSKYIFQKNDTVVLLAKRDQLPLVENLFRISSI